MKPKTWLWVIAAAVVGGTVAEKKYDVSSHIWEVAHRVDVALQNPDDRIKEAIDSFSDKDFIQKQTQKNLEYYQWKVSDSKLRDAIVSTATRYDIAVCLYEKGVLSGKDMIEYISLWRLPIVCLPSVSMTQTWTPTGGEAREITQQDLLYPQDVASSFTSQLVGDGWFTCDFTPRPQGGWYRVVIKDKNGNAIWTMEQAFKVR